MPCYKKDNPMWAAKRQFNHCAPTPATASAPSRSIEPPQTQSIKDVAEQALGLVVILLLVLFFGALIYSCSSDSQPTSTSVADTPREVPLGGRPTNPEAENTVKAILNLQGLLCAEILSVRPGTTQGTAKVTCTEYTGGTKRITYMVNLETATAHPLN